jgi:magnesium-transporting ATPase (P-type)
VITGDNSITTRAIAEKGIKSQQRYGRREIMDDAEMLKLNSQHHSSDRMFPTPNWRL